MTTCDQKLATVFAVIYGVVWLFFAVDPQTLQSPQAAAQHTKVLWDAQLQGQPVARPLRQNPSGGLYRAMELVLLGMGAAVLLGRHRESKALLQRVNLPLLVLLVLMPVSSLWSIDRANTVAHSLAVLCLVVFLAGTVLVGWHPQRFQNILRPVVSLLLVGSIVLYAVHPERAINQAEGVHGAWHGLADRTRAFGTLSSIAAVFWMHALLTQERRRLVNGAGMALALSCVLLSGSTTAVILSLLVFLFMSLLLRSARAARPYMPHALSFAVLALTYAASVAIVVPGTGLILKPAVLIGADSVLGNRLQIWSILKEQIQTWALLGCGYGAYWNGPDLGAASRIFMSRVYFYPGQAYNGYLEITNDLGFVGLALLAAFLLVYVLQSLQLMKTDRAQGTLFLALFLQQAIVNFSESTWLQINSPAMFMMMILAVFALARSAQLSEAGGSPTGDARELSRGAPVPGAENSGMAARIICDNISSQ